MAGVLTGVLDDGTPINLRVNDDGALIIEDNSLNAGARNFDSSTGLDHQTVAGEWKTTTLAVSGTGDYTALDFPCIVRQIRVRKTTNAGVATANTAGILLFKNGTSVFEGAAAAATPGTVLFDGLEGVICQTNLTVNFASASDTDKIEVVYRPLDLRVTW